MNRSMTCLTAFMCAAASGFAFGQAYPTKAIRIIAPFEPGGGTDE
jgi:tripartite-type tricarboxylate transporter receptor subunit TctC